MTHLFDDASQLSVSVGVGEEDLETSIADIISHGLLPNDVQKWNKSTISAKVDPVDNYGFSICSFVCSSITRLWDNADRPRFVFYDSDSSVVDTVPKPIFVPSESLIQVHASAINPSDVFNVEGRFPMTASMMLSRASVEKREYVLVLGSSGSVGSAAVQLARSMGAFPIPTSRKNNRSAVNITEDLAPHITNFTSGKGVTVILDTVGDAAIPRHSGSKRSLWVFSVIITTGKTPDLQFTLNTLDLYRKNAVIFGINMLAVSFHEGSKCSRS